MHRHNRIAVCTTTFYPQWEPAEEVTHERRKETNALKLREHHIQQLIDDGERVRAEHCIRGDLALKFMQRAMHHQYELIVVDGSPNSAFHAQLLLDGYPVQQEKQKGMSASRVQAFDAAYALPHVKAVVWSEPEKLNFVNELERCVKPVLRGEAAMVIPERNISGESTMPLYQRKSERQGNHIFSHLLRRANLLQGQNDLDVYFGPRIYSATEVFREKMQTILQRTFTFDSGPRNHSLLPYYKSLYAAVNPGAYLNATFFPIIAALHQNLPVQGVTTTFSYPPNQTMLEEHKVFAENYNAKRRRQLVDISLGTEHYLRMIGKLPGECWLHDSCGFGS